MYFLEVLCTLEGRWGLVAYVCLSPLFLLSKNVGGGRCFSCLREVSFYCYFPLLLDSFLKSCYVYTCVCGNILDTYTLRGRVDPSEGLVVPRFLRTEEGMRRKKATESCVRARVWLFAVSLCATPDDVAKCHNGTLSLSLGLGRRGLFFRG